MLSFSKLTYSIFIYLQSNFHELFWIIVISIILTLFFDTPFGNINKILFPNKDKKIVECAPDATTPTESKTITENNNEINKVKEIVYTENDIRELTHWYRK